MLGSGIVCCLEENESSTFWGNKVSIFNKTILTQNRDLEVGVGRGGCTGGVQPWVKAAGFTSSSFRFPEAPHSSCPESSAGTWTCSRAGPGSRRSAPGLPLSRNRDPLERTHGPTPSPRENQGLRNKLPDFQAPLPWLSFFFPGRFVTYRVSYIILNLLICKLESVLL